MAVTYGFYNSVNGDRKYNAEQMAQIFDGIINDGVFSSVGTAFKVLPSSGMVISVGAGRAWFNHTWTYNDAAITLTVSTAPAGTLSRIDAVVIEVDTNNRVNTIKIVAGTQAASPVRPTLTNSDGVYQYALAYITVAAGTTTITSAMIASVVGTDTPFVTGPLETVGVTALYDYWRAEFETWFDHLQDELDSNQAANLQHQIDDLESSKADATEVEAAISEIYKVGDLKSTTRTSLGDKWALANGDFVTNVEAEDYVSLDETALNYVTYELPDMNDIPSLCIATAFDENTNCLYALGAVVKLVGAVSDNYPTACDIWLYKSTNGGFTWTTEFKWCEAKPFALSSKSYYTNVINRTQQTGYYIDTLSKTLVKVFTVYKGVVIWLRPIRIESTSTTGSNQQTIADGLYYFNGSQSVDITNQYKCYTTISSIAQSDYLFAAYETEIDASQTKGLVLFIGTSTRLVFLAITVSGNVATVSGRLAYGNEGTIGNINSDGATKIIPSYASYIHNCRAIIKVPDSNYSLVAGGQSSVSNYITFGRIDCTRLFSEGLIENSTYMLFYRSSNNQGMDSTAYDCGTWINVGTGAVYFWVMGSSSSYYYYIVYFPWSAVLNWTTTTYWQTAAYYKSGTSQSDYLTAVSQLCSMGFIMATTSGPNGTLRCMCTYGIADLTWNTSSWRFSVSSVLYQLTDTTSINWTRANNIGFWCTTFTLTTLSNVMMAIPSNYNPSNSYFFAGRYCGGRFLPHVDAMYGDLYSSLNYYGRFDGISNVFVKIKE